MYETDETNTAITPYYTNKKAFDVIVVNQCLDVLYFWSPYTAVYTYYFGASTLTIPLSGDDRIRWNHAYCPWKLTVELYDSDGNLVGSLPTAITMQGDPSSY